MSPLVKLANANDNKAYHSQNKVNVQVIRTV